jgi:hypothetical protein
MHKFIFLAFSFFAGATSILGFQTLIGNKFYPLISFGSGLWFSVSLRFGKRYVDLCRGRLNGWESGDLPHISSIWGFTIGISILDVFLQAEKKLLDEMFFSICWSFSIFGAMVVCAQIITWVVDYFSYEEMELDNISVEVIRPIPVRSDCYGRITPSTDSNLR